MRTTWFAMILATLAVMSGACATPPKADIDAAKAAVDKAVAAKANQYAPESLKAAQDARAKLDAELKVQDEQMAMSEAFTLVVDAKARIQDAEADLDKAPKGKGAPADLDVMQSDLAAAKSTVGEAETALGSQRYPDAKAKAEAAKGTAASIVSSLERAHGVQQTARKGRR